MWEGRFAEDCPVVNHRLLAIHNRSVRFIQLVCNLIDEMVLLGDRDRASAAHSVSFLVPRVQTSRHNRASQSKDADQDSLSEPHIVGTSFSLPQ